MLDIYSKELGTPRAQLFETVTISGIFTQDFIQLTEFILNVIRSEYFNILILKY